MTRLVFHIERADLPAQPAEDEIHVWLYGASPPAAHIGTVGAQAIEIAARFGVRPSAAAIDFLSIAMAVTAADTFVARDDAADAWSRSFEIMLPLAEPQRWDPLKTELQAALRFLSNDHWTFTFLPGGMRPPLPSEIRRKLDVFDLSKVDCVSLFSGGLDSGIGALDLLASGCRPLLVSHATRGDARHQAALVDLLPAPRQRVSVNTYATWSGSDDDSMRTRSLQFLALGALSAQALAAFRDREAVELFVCQNGLIALNPPLTPRRIGSHSTRTAHPFFLRTVQNILSAAGLPVTIDNPYEFRTKGEMAKPHSKRPEFESFVEQTVSCGKWKRENQQCGRCVPCLIRRASLHSAGVTDRTSYQSPDLRQIANDETRRDDLIAVQSAILRYRGGDLRPWVLQAGPLPTDAAVRHGYFDVVHRGLDELELFLRASGLPL